MTVQSAQSITVEFTTRRFDTGASTNADSTPTGTLIVNGTDNAASVTVTNVTTGRYKAAVTLPTLAYGDICELAISATVNSVSDKAIVWRDSKDVIVNASGNAQADIQTIKTQTVTAAAGVTFPATISSFAGGAVASVTAGVTVATNNDKTGYSLTAGTGLGNQTANITGSLSGSVASVTGDVGGKVLGGGSGTITGTGVRADNRDGDAIPAAAQILAAGDIDGYAIEAALKLVLAACAGKSSGAGTGTEAIRAADDSKARITATVDSDGNRLAVTLDSTG